MAVARKKVSRKKPARKKVTTKAAARKKSSTKKSTRKKVSGRKPAAKKTARKAAKKKTSVKKAPAKKAAAKKAKRRTEKQSEIAVTPTSVDPSIEDRMAAPLSEIERVVDRVRDRADQLRAITNFDPFNPLTFNPMTWEIPSWKEIQHLFDIRVPIVDVVDREKDILVIAEVPGVEKDDIVVTATNRSVTIKGVRRDESRSENDDVHRHEIRKGSFSRTLALPEEVDGRKAKAIYRAGVIELRLPKRRVSKKHTVRLD